MFYLCIACVVIYTLLAAMGSSKFYRVFFLVIAFGFLILMIKIAIQEEKKPKPELKYNEIEQTTLETIKELGK